MTTNPDYYEALQVHPKADEAAIEAAYQRLSERYDPARLAGAADELLELARGKRDTIERAYAVLGDPARRAAYDRQQIGLALATNHDERPKTQDQGQPSAETVTPPSSSAVRQAPADEQLDYRPLPPARRQERQRGAAEPVLRANQHRPGRAIAPRPVRRLAGPLVAVGVLALVIASGLIATNGGGPPPAAPTPTASPFDTFEASIPQAQSFAEQNPASAQAWIDLGNLLYDSAQVVREQAPDSQLYQQRLGRWLQATTAYSQALALEPSNAPARADMGASACFYGAGTGDQSFVRTGLAEVNRAAAGAPDDARVLLSLGHCLVSADPPRTDEALAAWQRIIERNPSSPLVSQAQILIAKYKK